MMVSSFQRSAGQADLESLFFIASDKNSTVYTRIKKSYNYFFFFVQLLKMASLL
jgi:hypothetical protein